jgi:hypothetical protein
MEPIYFMSCNSFIDSTCLPLPLAWIRFCLLFPLVDLNDHLHYSLPVQPNHILTLLTLSLKKSQHDPSKCSYKATLCYNLEDKTLSKTHKFHKLSSVPKYKSIYTHTISVYINNMKEFLFKIYVKYVVKFCDILSSLLIYNLASK